MYVCMYVSMYLCIYVSMYVCIYVCMYALCMYALCMYALCMYTYMYVCMYMYECNCILTPSSSSPVGLDQVSMKLMVTSVTVSPTVTSPVCPMCPLTSSQRSRRRMTPGWPRGCWSCSGVSRTKLTPPETSSTLVYYY